MPPILIDTNMLVYLFEINDLVKQAQAQYVLDQIDLSKNGCISVQTLAEFFSTVTRRLRPPLTPAQALQQIELYQRMWRVFDLTPTVVLEAARGARDHQLSYYDAQIWAAARLNQVPVVFSEDFQHQQILEGVRFINPFSPDFELSMWL
jgi:predicted nucleic acid-binding protein